MDAAVEQQKDIGKAFREIADLRGEVREIRTALVGIDGQNGLRGEVRAFMETIQKQDRRLEEKIVAQEKAINDRLDEQDAVLQEITTKTTERIEKIEDSFMHYKEVERVSTCQGQKILDDHIYNDHIMPKKEETEIKVAKINAGSASWVQFLQLAGIIAVALITLAREFAK